VSILRRRWAVVSVVVALVVVVGLTSGEDDADAKAPSVATVVRGPITALVSSTGRIVPELDVEIKCEASGEVVAIPHDVSDVVKKGELLVELDPVDEQRRVQQAEIALSASRARVEQKRSSLTITERNLATSRTRALAALESAKVRAADARAKADRGKSLLEKRLLSQEQYDTLETAAAAAAADLTSARARIEELETEEMSLSISRQDLKLAEAQVASDEITLADARERLKETKVYAPIDGVVSDRSVEIGQIVSSGINNIAGGTTLMTVADLTRIYVLAAVDESDIGRVRVGQDADITVDAFPDETFGGNVARIATKGVNVSNVVTFEVKIEIVDDKKAMLKPEMTANVDVVTASKPDALHVPISAVTKTSDGYVAYVVPTNGPAGETAGAGERRPVTIGIRNDTTIEVVEGLAEDEKILLSTETAESRWRAERKRRGPFGPH